MYGHVCGVRLCLYACVYACAYLCVCTPREVGRSARMQPCDTGVPRPLRPFAIPSATRAAADRAAAVLGSTRLLPRALPPPHKEIDGGSAQSHFLTPRRRPLRGQQNSNPIPFIQREKKLTQNIKLINQFSIHSFTFTPFFPLFLPLLLPLQFPPPSSSSRSNCLQASWVTARRGPFTPVKVHLHTSLRSQKPGLGDHWAPPDRVFTTPRAYALLFVLWSL